MSYPVIFTRVKKMKILLNYSLSLTPKKALLKTGLQS